MGFTSYQQLKGPTFVTDTNGYNDEAWPLEADGSIRLDLRLSVYTAKSRFPLDRFTHDFYE